MSNNCNAIDHRFFLPMIITLLLVESVFSVRSQTITNLQGLIQTLELQPRVYRDMRLEVTVCGASRPKLGVLMVQDETGAELIEIGNTDQEIQPGERIGLRGRHCLLRKRDEGIEISAAPIVDNDGMHLPQPREGSVALKAGQNPIRVEWFNNLHGFNLEVSCLVSNLPQQSTGPSNFWHTAVDAAGRTNFVPGLRAECCEGYWEMMPNFDLLQPVKTGIETNFDLGFRTRDEMVGIRYTGYLNAPADGRYRFHVRSDDGSLLFIGQTELPVVRAGTTNVPMPDSGFCGQTMSNLFERRWMVVAGQANFISQNGAGLEFELRSDHDVISVRVTDAAGLDPLRLQNRRVSVTGVGRGLLTTDHRIILGKMCVADSKGIAFIEETFSDQPPLSITPIAHVRSLPLEEARRARQVRVQGVVTDVRNSVYDRRMSIQDATRGIFVNLDSITNSQLMTGEFVEVAGRSGAGDFAPVIIADKTTLLGPGHLPEPARPTWTELLNGSMDVQWAELQGLVTEVQSNKITLLLPEGRLDVLLDGHESGLKPFEKSVVRIRGVLYAVWNAETREVRLGSVLMRNATISVDASAPADPFDAVVKTPRELLLFDAQASAFRRVKVRGQIVYADATQLYLQEAGAGLRLMPAEKTEVRPGDVVEAVGYPDIGRTTLLLREVILRKNGEASLPDPKNLSESEYAREDLDSTRVRIQGQLLGWHFEQGAPVLEMQSRTRLYLARLAHAAQFSLRVGSELALDGVYVSRARNQGPNAGVESFELLLNSPADIKILSRPSWLTLPRLLILVGVLLLVLAFTAIWISQLRRLVEQRTTQLQREIRERERAEHQQALEAERSRIARDLHDDLGSSLTEISVLASTGQRPGSGETSHPNLFQAIAGKARSLIAALDVIVWAVDPEDNSLQSLADYLSGFTGDYLSHSGAACRFKVPVTFPPVTLDGQVRHELLMAVKEILNNIVRHAGATEVEFRMAVANDALEIVIADNGKGFATPTSRDGHGLKNLPARLGKLGGSCAVESRAGSGTTVNIRLPLCGATRKKASSPEA